MAWITLSAPLRDEYGRLFDTCEVRPGVASAVERLVTRIAAGYRRYHPEVRSPYLWSGSTHYTSGKYVEDGRWSDTAVSRQLGAAVLLRRMAELGLARFADAPATDVPRVRYAPRVVSEAA